MKHWIVFLLVFPLAACSLTTPTSTKKSTEKIIKPSLPDLGEAPELSNDVWLNSESPLRLAGLRGKVVLLDMWTFG